MQRNKSRQALENLSARLIGEFGASSAKAIQRIIIEELGNLRIRFPTIKEIEIEERNRRIRAAFKGDNHQELAMLWGISDRHVRRIVNRG